MKKKILSVVIAAVMIITTSLPVIQVSATPTEVDQARSQYQALKDKVEEINVKIQNIDAEISPLVQKMNENEVQISNINNQIDNTNKEIVQAKEDIGDQEEVLGDRLREVYKSGGQVSYLTVLLSSDSLSDLISNVDSAKRVVELDNKVVDELNASKDKLDEKVTSLQTKSEEIKTLNNEIKEKKNEAEAKKAEQQVLVDQAKKEQAEFDRLYLADEERKVVASYITTATSSSSSKEDLQSTIIQLRALRDKQIQSPTVKEEINSAIETAKKYVTQKQKEEEASAQSSRGNTTPTVSGSAIVNEAFKYLGTPYVWGGTTPSGFDCSGFTQYVYRACGKSIGRDTYAQASGGTEISASQLQPGDLVFPHSGHVEIYIGNGQVIHAPHTGDVVRVKPLGNVWKAVRY
jgi:cell wall-associated NlpC family hydrolase